MRFPTSCAGGLNKSSSPKMNFSQSNYVAGNYPSSGYKSTVSSSYSGLASSTSGQYKAASFQSPSSFQSSTSSPAASSGPSSLYSAGGGSGGYQGQSYGAYTPPASSAGYSQPATSNVAASYNGTAQFSTANKLTESLNKMAVKDSTELDGRFSAEGTTTCLSTATTTTSSSLAAGNVSVSSALGLASKAASLPTASTSSSGKPMPNLPPGVPLQLTQNYMIGQPAAGVPFAAAFQPIPPYSYEELQLLSQQRILVRLLLDCLISRSLWSKAQHLFI